MREFSSLPLLVFWVFIFFAALVPGLPLSSHADQLSSEELAFMEIGDVFAASKHLQAIQDAPASVTLVNDDEIFKYGYRNLTDVVRNVRGFYTYSDLNYDYIGVRGFARLGDYGNRVLQLVDGHTYNDNIYGTFSLGEVFGVEMDLIKKIEFVRGPGSALYGSNALFATVNILTKSGKDIDGLFTSAQVRSYDTYAGGFIYGKRFAGDLDLILSVSLLDGKGPDRYFTEFDDPATLYGHARNIDGEKARKFYVKAAYHDFTFTANLAWREKNVPTAAYGTIFGDNRFKTVDERDFAELRWNHAIDQDRSITSRIYYDRYYFSGDYPYDFPPVTINKDDVLGQWIGGELNYTHKIASFRTLVGLDGAYHLDANQRNYDKDPYADILNDKRNYTRWSAFLQEEWDPVKWFRFIAGLRYDNYSISGDHICPRAGLIFKPPTNSTFKLLYGQAFRAPNVYELYYSYVTGSSVYRANPDLKPEVLDTYEAVWEQEINPILKTTVSAFRYTVHDLITQVQNPDNSLQFQNISRVKSDGVEFGIEVAWPDFKAHLSYTRQETTDDLTGQWLPNSPRHLVKSGIIIPLYREKIFFGSALNYMSQRLDREGREVGANVVTDLTLSAKDIVNGLRLSVSAYNLFNESYADPVSADHLPRAIAQNGANYRFKLDYLF